MHALYFGGKNTHIHLHSHRNVMTVNNYDDLVQCF